MQESLLGSVRGWPAECPRPPLQPLRTLRSETKGQAGACPDRTRAIPCTLPAVTPAAADSNGDSNSTRQAV